MTTKIEPDTLKMNWAVFGWKDPKIFVVEFPHKVGNPNATAFIA